MLEIPQRNKIRAAVTLPGSKSITNRALVIGALARGETRLRNFLECEDTFVMTRALRELGFTIRQSGKSARVFGQGGKIPARRAQLNTINSGTTLRFLTTLVSLGEGLYSLDGNQRMRQRPVEPLLGSLRELGVDASSRQGNGCPPLQVNASGIPGGDCHLPGKLSSQFLSSLLLSGPYAQKDLIVNIQGELTSRPYVQMTISMMQEFGVSAQNKGFQTFNISRGQTYRGREYTIEGDASSASYFWTAGAITGGKVRVTNVGENSIQGDARFAELLEKMGADIRGGPDWLEVAGPLKRPVEVDLNDMPDMAPTLAVAALFVPGTTVIKNVANLRYKESDRLQALTTELNKLGAKVKELPDGLIIEGGKLRGAEIETYQDHRIAMALALVGLRVKGIKIKDPGCVGKTLPDYFPRLFSL